MLNLNDVALFVQVVRSGSFAGAAREMSLPSNTVSRRIQGLEAQLGVRLLQRSTRKLSLTAAGTSLFDRCGEAIDLVHDAGRDVLEGEPRGTVRVAAPVAFPDFFPMEWVQEFVERYPRVRLEFIVGDAPLDLIAERIDVAFRGGPVGDSGYVGRPIVSSRATCVASPAYLSKFGVPEDLASLAAHRCLTFPHGGDSATWRLGGPHQAEDVRVTGPFSANNTQSLHKAALAGLGIALLPSLTTQADVDAGRLVHVLPSHYREGVGLVLYPSRKHLAPAVAAFIELTLEKLVNASVVPALRSSGEGRSPE